MGRRRRFLAVVAPLVLGFGVTGGAMPIGGAEKRPEPVIRLEIEPLLIDSEGIHPLNQAYEDLAELEGWGAYHSLYRLGNGEGTLLYKLTYKMAGADLIDLSLERSLERKGSARETMPVLEHRMQVFETWTPRIMEEMGGGTRLMLRVVPILRPRVKDAPLDSSSFQMWFYGGPLVAFGNGAGDDRIIFREVNTAGGLGGLKLGIPNVGEVKLSFREFPGSAPCGAVRGATLEFELGGKEYRIYSTRPILPDDPRRPGVGWILYGSLDASADVESGYYGTFLTR